MNRKQFREIHGHHLGQYSIHRFILIQTDSLAKTWRVFIDRVKTLHDELSKRKIRRQAHRSGTREDNQEGYLSVRMARQFIKTR